MADIPKRRGLAEAWYTDRGWDIDSALGTVAYSPQYSDDEYVYRHITVSRKALKKAKELLHAHHSMYKRNRDCHGANVYPLASRDGQPLLPYDDIVQRLHVHMSNDWMLYLIHDRDLTLCFRRPRRDKQ